MRRKEVLFAVIGGIVGAVLTMAAGSFSPLGAHDEKANLNVGEITCTRLSVVDEDGLRVLIDKGVAVLSKDGAGMASMVIDGHGGVVEAVRGDLDKNRESWASMSVNEHGVFVYVVGKDGESWAGMVIGEHGGVVSMNGKDANSKAGIGIDEIGGVVNLYGKDGKLNRLTPE